MFGSFWEDCEILVIYPDDTVLVEHYDDFSEETYVLTRRLPELRPKGDE
jgi:hypothetical protein